MLDGGPGEVAPREMCGECVGDIGEPGALQVA
jgi:hypothetical protein